MSLVEVHFALGQSREIKKNIRRDIAEHFGEIAQAPSKYFMVNFVEYPDANYDSVFNDAFIWVYATEGHCKERKEKMCQQFTEDVCRYTGLSTSRTSFFFFDVSKGNMGSGGKIVNYRGLVADQLRDGKIGGNELP